MRSRTIDLIVADIQDRANLASGDQFTTRTTLLEYANQSIARLYGMLVQARGQAYYSTTGPPFLTTGATLYALPSDFWQMQVVEVDVGGFKRAIQPFMMKEAPRWGEMSTVPGLTINFRYVPAPQRLQLDLNESFDGIAGWEEWAILDAVIKARSKEDLDCSEFRLQRMDIEKQIEQLATERDAQWPERITDEYERRDWGFTNGIPRYRITGPQPANGFPNNDLIEILWGPLPGVAWWS